MNTTYPPLAILAKVNSAHPGHKLFATAVRRALELDAIWKEVLASGVLYAELVRTSDGLACVVMPDPSEPGRYRAQYHTPSGLIGHSTRDTLEEVVVMVLKEGLTTISPGLLNQRFSTWPSAA